MLRQIRYCFPNMYRRSALILAALWILGAGGFMPLANEGDDPVAAEQVKIIKDRVLKDFESDYLIPSIGYKMIYISPGTFKMGSPFSEQGRYDDELRHTVTLTKGFYMGAAEVTQEQWKKIMGNNPSTFKNCGSDCPVEQVSWNDCQEFILHLNRHEKTRRFRLPTEAEWEYACRAGSGLAFANGDITETKCGYDPNLDTIGWYCGNTEEKTQPVAKKGPNAWGLYDMHGNVWEWCQDWYGEYKLGHVADPKGPASGSGRVFRGGGWGLNARTCRSAFRDKYAPDLKCKFLGFRLARDAE